MEVWTSLGSGHPGRRLAGDSHHPEPSLSEMWLWAFLTGEDLRIFQPFSKDLLDTWPDCRNQSQGSKEDKEPALQGMEGKP